MSSVKAYIWGIRYGFRAKEALFPERARVNVEDLAEYNEAVQLFTEEKDLLFRNARKDFYYLTKANRKLMYSLVISDHQDIAGRRSYLVFSIVIPEGKQIGQDVTALLKKLRDLYKEKNADYAVDRNLFTQTHIDEILQGLVLVNGNPPRIGASSVILFEDEALLSRELGKYTGNEVYFIPENSNPEIITQLNFRSEKLTSYNAKQSTSATATAEWNIANKNTQSLKILSYQEEFKAELDQLNLSKSHHPTRALELLRLNPDLKQSVPDSIYQQLLKRQNDMLHADKDKKASDVKYVIDKARKNNWQSDFFELEKLEPFEDLLTQEQKVEVSQWRNASDERKTFQLKNNVHALYKDLKKSPKSHITSRLREYEEQTDSLLHAISALPEGRKKVIVELPEYRYIKSKKWIPKKRPIAFIAVATIMLLGAGFGIYFWMTTASEAAAKQASIDNADDDKDGKKNISDTERNTLWLSDTSKYKLSNYVTADGTLDRIKVDNLCNCFAVPDSTERAKIKCKDNAEYFVFEGKLWHYDEASNRFYDKDSTPVKNGNNAITRHHDKLTKVNSKSESTTSNGTTEVTFKNVKYTVREEFKNLTTANGIKMPYMKDFVDYRYFSKKWETRPSSGVGPWKLAEDENVRFVLGQIGKKVSTGTKPTTEKNEIGDKTVKPSDVGAKDNSDTGNAADKFYLGYCEDGEPTKLFKDVIRNERVKIENYTGSPETKKGKSAKTKIDKFLKNNRQ
jgi:hypothetical protein